jgi:hypothetical protein
LRKLRSRQKQRGGPARATVRDAPRRCLKQRSGERESGCGKIVELDCVARR